MVQVIVLMIVILSLILGFGCRHICTLGVKMWQPLFIFFQIIKLTSGAH